MLIYLLLFYLSIFLSIYSFVHFLFIYLSLYIYHHQRRIHHNQYCYHCYHYYHYHYCVIIVANIAIIIAILLSLLSLLFSLPIIIVVFITYFHHYCCNYQFVHSNITNCDPGSWLLEYVTDTGTFDVHHSLGILCRKNPMHTHSKWNLSYLLFHSVLAKYLLSNLIRILSVYIRPWLWFAWVKYSANDYTCIQITDIFSITSLAVSWIQQTGVELWRRVWLRRRSYFVTAWSASLIWTPNWDNR